MLTIKKISDCKAGLKNVCVEAVIKSKTELKTFTSNKGSGEMFRMNLGLMDGNIACVSFTKTLHEQCIVNDGFQFKKVDINYNKFLKNMEIVFTNKTILEPCSVKSKEAKFKKIRDVVIGEETINLCGVITNIEEEKEVEVARNRESVKVSMLKLKMQDSTGMISVVLWDSQLSLKENDILCIENGVIKTYNDSYEISINSATIVDVNKKDCLLSKSVEQWFKENAENTSSIDFSIVKDSKNQNSSSSSDNGCSSKRKSSEIEDLDEEIKLLQRKKLKLLLE